MKSGFFVWSNGTSVSLVYLAGYLLECISLFSSLSPSPFLIIT